MSSSRNAAHVRPAHLFELTVARCLPLGSLRQLRGTPRLLRPRSQHETTSRELAAQLRHAEAQAAEHRGHRQELEQDAARRREK